MTASKKFFTKEKRKQITDAIAHAEKQSSGEIRLFIDDECKDDVLDRAAFIFKQLEMHKTELRNGVLIYLAMNSRKFAILGDVGIHSKVGEDFWHEAKNEMLQHFVKGDFVTGLTHGIGKAGDALKKHFPHQENDINELPDEIVFGKD